MEPMKEATTAFELIRNYLGEAEDKPRVGSEKQAIPISVAVK